MAVCRRYLYALLERVRSRKVQPQDANKIAIQKSQTVDIEELKSAEREIIRQVQGDAFEKEIKTLMSLVSTKEMQRDEARKRNQEIKQASMLYRLDPSLDREEILRVGGRIKQASLDEDIKNPVILPKKGHVTALLIKNFFMRKPTTKEEVLPLTNFARTATGSLDAVVLCQALLRTASPASDYERMSKSKKWQTFPKTEWNHLLLLPIAASTCSGHGT